MGAYDVLIHSSNDSGRIPLSELKVYEEKFGLIGSFDEFVFMIYAIRDCISAYHDIKNKKS